MAGSLIRDALAPNLLSGATLTAAGTTNGTIVELVYPQDISFVLDTGTVTGTSPTISVVLQGSDSSTFASGVVTYGTLAILSGTAAAQSSVSKQINAYVHHRFVRAAVTLAGTSPVYTGSVLAPRQKHDRRTKATTA